MALTVEQAFVTAGADGTAGRPSLARAVAVILAWLPRGGALPMATWQLRHRHIVTVSYLLSVGCVFFAMFRGYSIAESLGLGGLVAVPALLARHAFGRRTLMSSVAALALLNAAAVIIEAAGGATEAHFSFFVVIGLLTLYQDWSPFLISIGYVVIHHGVMGTMMPMDVFDHASAWHNPWGWALIHGAFILAASVTYVVAWRMNELYRSEAASATEQLRTSEERFRSLVQRSSDVTMVCDRDGLLSYVSPASLPVLGLQSGELTGHDVLNFLHPDDRQALADALSGASDLESHILECRLAAVGDQDPSWVELAITDLSAEASVVGVVLHVRDVTLRRQLESELRHAQKLESVGQLAAGIAHEINTPIQFVGDNLRFLSDAFRDQLRVLTGYRKAAGAPDDETGRLDLAAARELEETLDCAFLASEVPLAIGQTLEGIERVATIVRAMKAFGHPSSETMAPTDLNEAIRNTLIVANNALKYTANVVTEFGDLPSVRCHVGEINQVVLNLVVNASQAIAEHSTGELGQISVRTFCDDTDAVIEISDSGGGIPAGIRERIFEPFYTTKEVGVGTGQGLSIAYSIMHDRHAGSISVANKGTGAVFTVRLPIGSIETLAVVR